LKTTAQIFNLEVVSLRHLTYNINFENISLRIKSTQLRVIRKPVNLKKSNVQELPLLVIKYLNIISKKRHKAMVDDGTGLLGYE